MRVVIPHVLLTHLFILVIWRYVTALRYNVVRHVEAATGPTCKTAVTASTRRPPAACSMEGPALVKCRMDILWTRKMSIESCSNGANTQLMSCDLKRDVCAPPPLTVFHVVVGVSAECRRCLSKLTHTRSHCVVPLVWLVAGINVHPIRSDMSLLLLKRRVRDPTCHD